MDNFYIITNSEKDKNLEFTNNVVKYIEKKGGHCEVQLAGRQKDSPFHYTDPRKIPEGTRVCAGTWRRWNPSAGGP